eukprot:Gregarina_sp_Pseudo_9__5732@NODE_835_length_2148_cov_101_395448_g783_i0_p1_GENE_NODE_835_length_2148_cov_101_395448_g783_i0NODE_835_length_2148_cov_101_395448_g783_i0_p1_ORF_typecomplete_len513_score197_93zfCCCH/PF00642_24/27zfCCCH/PF00642_24/0_018zfCCCH/PF00642_24/2_4zfCCCH/PF00642_24/5_1e07zfCCCH_3/PF15663_5/1_8e05zfCCCH_3/PF15663_5/0_0021zfCCCH_3/PF15663_5/2e03zfCCCH_4/PF18044_1/0_0097zfCCCH_4/PF18044_1/2_4e03zfCCCH_4/PF18044_1/0_00025zf_CCCH_4/PF18345_1/0_014zf_CCCH_4/PF18345_1/43zf_CCCH_4/P
MTSPSSSYTQSMYTAGGCLGNSSPSRQFNHNGGGSIPPAAPQYFRLQPPSLDSRTASNVTLPALSKFYVSRGGILDPAARAESGDGVSRTEAGDAVSVSAEGGKALPASSGASSADGAEWTLCGASTNQSTRPSSAQRLETETAPRCAETASRRGAETETSRSAGPSALTLSSPTALLSSAPEWQSQFYRTKLCPFYVKDIPDPQAASCIGTNVGWAGGDCVNGANCRFAHSTVELRPLPDLRKTKLCSSYTKKVPCKNPKCPFAHAPKELRTSSSVFYKVTLCNFYKNGKCWNGANCRFAHGNEELRNSQPAPSKRAVPGEQPGGRRLRNKEGLLPKPATAVPPPPPSETETDYRRPSLSSLSTTDTSMATWKAAFERQGVSCQAVHEECCMETETATDDAWFDGDEVPEDPPGFSPLVDGDGDAQQAQARLSPELFSLLIDALASLRTTALPPTAGDAALLETETALLETETALLETAPPLLSRSEDGGDADDLGSLQVLLKYVQGQLDS